MRSGLDADLRLASRRRRRGEGALRARRRLRSGALRRRPVRDRGRRAGEPERALDGAGWSPLGPGLDDAVLSLCVLDDGGGPALFAGGDFDAAGGVAASGIARWDGAAWSPVGAGFGSTVSALCAFDEGSGPALFAGGDFGLERWDGASWSKTGGGVNLPVHALAVHHGGAGPVLCAGWILLAPAPPPAAIAQAPLVAQSAAFSLAVPASPALVGATVALQAAAAGGPPGFPVELTNALIVRLIEPGGAGG